MFENKDRPNRRSSYESVGIKGVGHKFLSITSLIVLAAAVSKAKEIGDTCASNEEPNRNFD